MKTQRDTNMQKIFFFFNDTATTEIYTLFPTRRSSDLVLHVHDLHRPRRQVPAPRVRRVGVRSAVARSEEHTSELQSQSNLVCRLLLEKKNKKPNIRHQHPKQTRQHRTSNQTS